MVSPVSNGANGRDSAGRFSPGCRGGPGNPHARRVAELRATLFDTVTVDDFRAIVGKVVERAKSGDLAAIKELLDRLLGKPTTFVDVEAVATLSGHSAADSAALRRELLNDPAYLDFLRRNAITEDGGSGTD